MSESQDQNQNQKYIIEYKTKEGSPKHGVHMNQEMSIRKIDDNDPLFSMGDKDSNRGTYNGENVKFFDGNEEGLKKAREEIQRDLQSKKDFVLDNNGPVTRVARSIGTAIKKGLRMFSSSHEDRNDRLLTDQITNDYKKDTDYFQAVATDPEKIAKETKVIDSTMPKMGENKSMDVNAEGKRKHLNMGSSISLSDKSMDKNIDRNREFSPSP